MRTVTLRVLCEGATERGFVKQVLAPHLRAFRVYATGQGLQPKGDGIVPFGRLRAAVKNELDPSRNHVFVTTMIDLYRLGMYPGMEKLPGESVSVRVQRIEAAMLEGLPNPRFIPHVQVHEFEALVYTDLDQLPAAFPDENIGPAVDGLRVDVSGLEPEQINDSELTAPSKRLIKYIPAYKTRKASVGPTITQRIGMARLRAACPHFHAWVGKLELLAGLE